MGAALVLADVTRFLLLDRLKSDLAATVSHEFKTPLTSLRLAVHVLLEEAVGPLTAKQTELLLQAREDTERLLHMIESLLTLARLERGDGMSMRTVDPLSLLRTVAANAMPRAEDKHVGLMVEGEEGPQVRADPERMAQALNNLVDNALTHTPPGGKVVLGASLEDGKVVLSVRDTGPGIPPEWLPRVFTRFFRVPGQQHPGTGLGLHIVQEIAQAHNGEVACESTPGQGTTFRLAFPVAGDRR
ncbi:MAG: HAMP domain-containing histidine kinase [Gemmataceae bacterium]|nr:HAMP domain-containing histidine kinase [Gemmataceae bacterium]